MNISYIVRKLHKEYIKYGGLKYTINEPTTILNHSLQTAEWMNRYTYNDPKFVVIGLFHDYGHITKKKPIDPDTGIDDKHELIGSTALKLMGFPESIYKPISLHVIAKRYLCTIDDEYYKKLSHGSKLSFALQGGKLSEQELWNFEKNKYFKDSLILRYADDLGKSLESKLRYKTIYDYKTHIEYVLHRL